MIDSYAELSRKIDWLKPIASIFLIGFVSLFIYSAIFRKSSETDVWMIPSIIGAIWSLLLISIINTFPHVPPKPTVEDKFFKRIKIRFKRGVYHLIGLFFLVLSIAIILLSLKLFGVWRVDY